MNYFFWRGPLVFLLLMKAEPVTEINEVFTLAEEFINRTSRSLFLTGKAGTGKTTFLRHICKTTSKNKVVLAPTGVAAIHCGGATLHSFFQLPFSPFVPEAQYFAEPSTDLSDHYSLLKNLRIDSEKRNIFRELELMIIDEVSMVRCDVLDAIDTILRHFRKRPHTPFGGVQVLFIGDLFQLPPVVPDEQWSILEKYYDGPFFFQARVMQQLDPLHLELKVIYRQRDQRFVNLLNRVRNNEVQRDDLELLNERFNPAFRPDREGDYITLTTHNYKADAINTEELAQLPGKEYHFKGEVEGNFSDRNFPTDLVLKLKEGAQIMFLRNDMERVKRYYNGKIGIVKEINDDSIIVTFPNEGHNELKVEKETWENIRYRFNPDTRRVEEEVLGTFTQYAIRLAWAVTIHKSQGLTFDRVIIDAGKSFAAGQVYVALSRCTTLEGIVLRSRIFSSSIITDERVLKFAEEEDVPETLSPVLEAEQKRYRLSVLLDIFNWERIDEALHAFEEQLQERTFKKKAEAESLSRLLLAESTDLQAVSGRFHNQLTTLFEQYLLHHDYSIVSNRIDAAIEYFTDNIQRLLIAPLQEHKEIMKEQKKVKGYLKEVDILIQFLEDSKKLLLRAKDVK